MIRLIPPLFGVPLHEGLWKRGTIARSCEASVMLPMVPSSPQLCSAPPLVVMESEGEMANALTNITKLEGLKSWKNGRAAPYQGVVKRDWVPTGRIDFGTNLNGNDNPDQPSEYRLLVEERRIIESIAGNENLVIQWRAATLREAKAVVTQYHKYLKENSLIQSIFEPDILPPAESKRQN